MPKKRDAASAEQSKFPPTIAADSARARLMLCTAAFVSGAATLIIELAGNRLLAPKFGNSLYTWTSLIGVVLVAISLGDYLGGRLVDRRPRMAVLGYLLVAAAAWTMLVPTIQDRLYPATAVSAGLVRGPLIASLALFSGPACLLAAVCPFIVRLLSGLGDDRRIGLSAGLVGMLATLGSFVGTFAAGFYLIPEIGVRALFLATGVAVGALGLATLWVFRRESAVRVVPAMLVLIAAVLVGIADRPRLPANVLFQRTTFYHDVRVEENVENGRRVRLLYLDTTQDGGRYVDDGAIYFGYQQYWRLAEVLTPQLQRALFLGGGGFAMPEHLSRRFPEAAIDAVEIDPEVIDVGRRYFDLDAYPQVKPFAADARRFLLERDERYDLIFGDVYAGVFNIPAHLVTTEFFALVKSRLTDGGFYWMNMPCACGGDDRRLFQTLMKTVETQFAHAAVFALEPRRLDAVQNLILVASDRDVSGLFDAFKTDDESLRGLLAKRIDAAYYRDLDVAPLTDDRNPIENLVARQVARVAAGR